MKGTAPRGRTPEEDEEQRAWLRRDEKSRAENLMIVDLLRNDLTRISRIGSVRTESLFDSETYRSLHQMTSTISAEMRPDVGFAAAMRALFPSGSVTGAPKIRAMEIIREVENGERHAYTGSIGYAAPDGDFRFNVAIRTAVIAADGEGEIGIGGGIVADSNPLSEYEECLLKLSFFSEPHQPFSLIETLRWEAASGFHLLQRHLARLQSSADYFAFPFDRQAVEQALNSAVAGRASPLRVRLLLDEEGHLNATATELDRAGPLRFAIAPTPVDSRNRFLFHKTTKRAFYEGPREVFGRSMGVEELLFVNERGELTEGSFTTLFVARDGLLLTPPVRCGLLPGTLRAELLSEGKAIEQVLWPADLANAEAIYLGNSVRGLMPAWLVDEPALVSESAN